MGSEVFGDHRWMGRRPAGLWLIIGYKVFSATVLICTAIAVLLTLKNHGALLEWSDQLVLANHRGIVQWSLEHLLQLRPQTLAFSALATFLYGALSALEAVALWLEQAWGRWLVLLSVGLSIPFELYELSRGVLIVKGIVLLLNGIIFGYVLTRFPKEPHALGKRRT